MIVKPVRPGATRAALCPPRASPWPGRVGGNTHLLLASPGVSWRPMAGVSATQPILGTVTVADVAWIAHRQHGFLGLGAGTYNIAGRWRRPTSCGWWRIERAPARAICRRVLSLRV